MFDGGEIIGGPLKRADGSNGGMIESNRGEGRHYMGHSLANACPQNGPLTKNQGLPIDTKTNEITDPQVT